MAYHVNVNPHHVRWRPSAVCSWWDWWDCRIEAQNTGHLAWSWYKNNFLLANPEKFKSLTVNPRNIDAQNDDKTLNIDNYDIRKTEQIKLLGVYIDENLNFAGHISELCTRASQKVGILEHLRNLIPCNAKLMLNKTSILPHLTYFHLVWKFCKSSDSRKIERIQERALYEELLTRAKLPTLYNRRLQHIAILMYKVKYGMAQRCVSELFTIKSIHQRLRKCDFELLRFDTAAYGRHSLRYQRPFIWSKEEEWAQKLHKPQSIQETYTRFGPFEPCR